MGDDQKTNGEAAGSFSEREYLSSPQTRELRKGRHPGSLGQLPNRSGGIAANAAGLRRKKQVYDCPVVQLGEIIKKLADGIKVFWRVEAQ